MSHFTVLVIGDNPEEQLAPYHEFESTGEELGVVEVDKTEYLREAWLADNVKRLVDTEGGLHESWDDAFWHEPTTEESVLIDLGKFEGKTRDDYKHGKRTLVFRIPEGWEERTFPRSEVESFRDYANGYFSSAFIGENETPDYAGSCKYGYNRVNAAGECIQVIDRTNPNAKWDWYSLGGRWTGFFKLKKDANLDEVALGRPGAFNNQPKSGWVDVARKRDIDFAGMREEYIKKELEKFDTVKEIIGDREVPSWEEIAKEHGEDNVDEARKAWWSNPVVEDLQKANLLPWRGEIIEDYCNFDRAAFIEQAGNKAISTFAVLKDGKWYEKGEMGWWTIVTNDGMKEAEWYAQFAKLLDETPDDTWLSVYDCHI